MQLEALTQYTQRARPELASHFATARETVRAMVSDLAPEMQKYAHIFGDHPTLIAMKAKLVEIFAARSGVPKTARILQSN